MCLEITIIECTLRLAWHVCVVQLLETNELSIVLEDNTSESLLVLWSKQTQNYVYYLLLFIL